MDAVRAVRWIVRASLVLALTACGLAAPEPASSPSPRGTRVLHATGDVGLDPRQTPTFADHGYGWAWSGLRGLFEGDDLTVANLECPATDIAAPIDKAMTFRCDPAALPPAMTAGIDVVSQGNNHAFDQGPEGLLDSLAEIRAAGLDVVGAGANRAEALRAAIVRREGWTIALLGFDQVADPPGSVAGADRPGTAAGHDFGTIRRTIEGVATDADLVVVMIHWGVEGSVYPTALQVREAHRMVVAGADVIVGSHAHRLQPMETYRGRPIFYGLGNTVWPRIDGASGGIAEVIVGADGSIEGRIVPVEIVAHGHPVVSGGR